MDFNRQLFCSPKDIWQCLEKSKVVTTEMGGGEGFSGIPFLEFWDTAEGEKNLAPQNMPLGIGLC